MIPGAGCNIACDYVQVDEGTLPVIDNEKRRAVKGYVWSVVNVMTGDRFFYEHGSRSARVAMGLLKDFTGAIQSDGYIVYEHFEGMEASVLKCPPKSLMEEAISYTYKILKKLSLYVTDGRYKIDDNIVENSIRPLAIARTICSAVTTPPHRGQPWSTPCLPPARHTALMNGRGLRMSCAGSRNTNRQGKTTQTFFPQTGAPCPQSNSNQYHTPIKRLQPASH